MKKTESSDFYQRLKNERKRQKNNVPDSETKTLNQQEKILREKLTQDNLNLDQKKELIIQLIINLDNQRQKLLINLSRKKKPQQRLNQRARLRRVRRQIKQQRKTFFNLE